MKFKVTALLRPHTGTEPIELNYVSNGSPTRAIAAVATVLGDTEDPTMPQFAPKLISITVTAIHEEN